MTHYVVSQYIHRRTLICTIIVYIIAVRIFSTQSNPKNPLVASAKTSRIFYSYFLPLVWMTETGVSSHRTTKCRIPIDIIRYYRIHV